jgi:hypothetical protein
VQTIKDHFIPVAVDVDMLNVLEDAEGKFARDSRMFLSGSSGGVSFLTASGKLLGKNVLHGTTGAAIREALQTWNTLPESERKPGAIQVGERGPIDTKHATVQPPAGCLILKVYGRYLARDARGELRTTTLLGDFPGIEKSATSFPGHFEYNNEANPDFMWLTETEWKSLVPASPRKGDRFPLPAAVVQRMCWYHLLPNAMTGRTGDTWGSVGPKEKRGIRAGEATLTVEEVSDAGIRLTLQGFVHLGNAYNPAAGAPKTNKEYLETLGYEASLRGRLTYDAAKKAFTQFDVVALGDLYGEALENSWFFRPGRNPVGFAFELSNGQAPAERLPPRGNMTQSVLERYLGTGSGR